MTQPFQDVVSSINGRLKAREVINLIGFRPDGLMTVGTRLKGFCPVHRSESFKSLQIDEQTNLCQCIVKDCAAYEPCTLVELYARAKGIANVSAAVELARAFNIELGGEAADSIGRFYADEARAASTAGRHDDAIASLRVAAGVRPGDAGIVRQLAMFSESAGKPTEAVAYWTTLLEMQAAEDPAAAFQTLTAEALRLDPGNVALLERQAELMRAAGAEASQWAPVLWQAAEKRLAQGQLPKALAQLQEVAAVLTDDPRLLLQLGILLHDEGQHDKACENLRKAAKLYEKKKQRGEAIACWEKLSAIEPGDEAVRERLAGLKADNGDLKTFSRELMSLAQLALNRGDDDRAEFLFHEVIGRDEAHEGALAGLIALADKRGDALLRVELLLKKARFEEEGGDKGRLAAVLEDILAGSPEDVGHQQETARLLQLLGRQNEALELYARAAALRVVLQDVDEARVLYRRVIDLDPANAERRGRIMAELLGQDQKRLAAELATLWAQKLMAGGEREAAAMLLEQAIQQCGRLAELEDPAITLLQEIGDRDRLVGVLIPAFERLVRFDRFEEARNRIVSALERFPGDLLLLERFADLLMLEDRSEEARAVLLDIASEPTASLDLRIRAAEQAIELDLADYDSLLLLATLHEENGDSARAAAACQSAAETLLSEGETAKAVDAMNRAARLTPNEPRLREFAADLALRSGDSTRAELLYHEYAEAAEAANDGSDIPAVWDRILGKMPASVPLRRGAADFYNRHGDGGKAGTLLAQAAEQLLNDSTSSHELDDLIWLAREAAPDDPRVLIVSGRAALRGKRPKDAAAAWRAARDEASRRDDTNLSHEVTDMLEFHGLLDPEERLALAEHRQALGEVEDARSILQELMELPPQTMSDAVRLLVLLKLFEMGEDNLARREQLAGLLEGAGRNAEAAAQMVLVAQSLAELDGTGEAIELLRRAKELDPSALATAELLTELLIQVGEWEEASDTIPRLAERLVKADRAGRALELLSALRTMQPERPGLELTNAIVLRSLDRNEEAVDSYSRAAALFEATGQLGEAAASLRSQLELEDDNLAAREHRATLLRKAGREDEARDEYYALLDRVIQGADPIFVVPLAQAIEALDGESWERYRRLPDLMEQHGARDQAEESVARFLLQARDNGRLEDAEQAVNFLMERRLNDPSLMEILAELQFLQEREDEGELTFATLISQLKELDELDEAMAVAERAIVLMPHSERLLRLLMECQVVAGDTESAAETAEALITAWREDERHEEAVLLAEVILVGQPDRVDFAILKAELLLEDGRGQAATEFLRQYARSFEEENPRVARQALDFLLEQFPESSADQAALYRVVVRAEGREAARPLQSRVLEMMLHQGYSLDSIKASVRELIAEDPDHIELRARYVEVLSGYGEWEGAVEQSLQLARLLSAAGRRDEAVQRLEAAADWKPDPAVRELLAKELEEAGRIAEAVAAWRLIAQKYRDAQKSPELAAALRHLVRLVPGDASLQRELGLLLASSTDVAAQSEAVEMLAAAAESRLAEGDAPGAAELLTEALRLSPDDTLLLGRHADALLATNDAEGSLRSRLRQLALEIAGEHPAEALRVAEQGLAEHPSNLTIRHELATVLLGQGNLPRYAEQMGLIIEADVAEKRTADAAVKLGRAADALMVRRSAILAGDLLARFDELTSDVPDLCRLKALSLEERGDNAAAAIHWAQLGALHRDAANWEEAVGALHRAVALEPKSIPWRIKLADALRGARNTPELLNELRELTSLHLQSGETEAAIVLCREILAADPEDIPALRQLADLLTLEERKDEADVVRLRIANLLTTAGKYAAAEELYEDLATRDGQATAALRGLVQLHEQQENMDAHLTAARRLARIFDNQQLLEDANAILERIALHHPADVDSRARLAEYYQQAGETDKAAAWLRELGRIYLAAGALDKAADALHQAEKLEPEDADALEILAELYGRLMDVAEAAKYFVEAGRRHLAAGRHDAALGSADKLLQVDPYHAEAHDLKALVYTERGDKAPAIKELELLAHLYQTAEVPLREADCLARILALEPASHAMRERLAMIQGEQGQEEAAADNLLLLAQAKVSQEDPTGAIDTLETALTLHPEHVGCHQLLLRLYVDEAMPEEAREIALWLAEYQLRQREIDHAIETLRLALTVEPNGLLELKLARALVRSSRGDEATAAFERAVPLFPEGSRQRLEALQGLFERNPQSADIFQRFVAEAIAQNEHDAAMMAWLRRADQLLELGDIDDARALLEGAGEKIPNGESLHRGAIDLYKRHGLPELGARHAAELATILAKAGRDEEALAMARMALELKPRDLQALRVKIELGLRFAELPPDLLQDAVMAMDLLSDREQQSEALAIGQSVIARLPEEIALRSRIVRILALRQDVTGQTMHLRDLAVLYESAGMLQEAADTCRALIALRPDDSRARRAYIDAYRRVGPETDLINDYRHLAQLHAKSGAIVEASRVYEQLLAVDPSRYDLHEEFVRLLIASGERVRALDQAYKLAQALTAAKQGRKALDLLQALGVREGQDAYHHQLMGEAHLSLNSRGMAVKELRVAATIYEKESRFAESAALRERMLSIDPLNLELRQQLIDLLLRADMLEEAMIAIEELAERYHERGLFDLAEVEARRLLAMDTDRPDAWRLLFRAATMLGDERLLVGDYLEFAEVMARRGEVRESLDYYLKVMELDPRNLRAHRGYVTQYPKVGRLDEIVPEVLAYAQLLVEEGQADDAARYFELIMSIDPGNPVARDMLAATQSRALGSEDGHPSERRSPSSSDIFPIPSFESLGMGSESQFNDERLSDTQKRFIRDRVTSASDYLAGTLDAMDREESNETLAQVVANYRTILAANSQNAQMRIKLADVLEQMGRIPEVLNELSMAADTLFVRGELALCVVVCERYLGLNPTDQRMRKRLSEAVVKRDAMKALESAIIFDDEDEDRGGHKGSTGGSGSTHG